MSFRAAHLNWHESAMRCPCAERARQAKVLDGIFGTGKPKAMYADYTFQTWDRLPRSDRDGKQEARQLCGLMAEGPFEIDGIRRIGLVLSGATGTTKSGLASCVLREWALRGTNCLWMDFATLINSVKATYDDDAEYDTNQVIAQVSQAPFLLLDDLGEKRGVYWNEHTLNILWQVINNRYAAMLPGIITTNWDWPLFCQKLDKPLAYRLVQLYQWVSVGGRNLREGES